MVDSQANPKVKHGHETKLELSSTVDSNELQELFSELRSEIHWITNPNSSAEDEEFPDPASIPNQQRRLVIRSIASNIEAIANALKSAALSEWSSESLSIPERALALDQTYTLKEDGTARVSVAKSTTSANLLFAFGIYAKASQARFVLDKSKAGWQDFQHFIHVRDRLTHPKRLSDISVSDEEIATAFRTLHWFDAQLIALLITTVASLKREVRNQRLLATAET